MLTPALRAALYGHTVDSHYMAGSFEHMQQVCRGCGCSMSMAATKTPFLIAPHSIICTGSSASRPVLLACSLECLRLYFDACRWGIKERSCVPAFTVTTPPMASAHTLYCSMCSHKHVHGVTGRGKTPHSFFASIIIMRNKDSYFVCSKDCANKFYSLCASFVTPKRASTDTAAPAAVPMATTITPTTTTPVVTAVIPMTPPTSPALSLTCQEENLIFEIDLDYSAWTPQEEAERPHELDSITDMDLLEEFF